MILPPKWSINMGPGVDMRGLCVGQPPRRLRPRVLLANEAAAARSVKVGGRVLTYPIFTCSCVCEQPVCQNCGRLVPLSHLSGSV